MWEKRSHILAPLNGLARSKKKNNWQWTEVEQAAFDEAKAMLAQELILYYPDFSKPFVIHSDVSDLQLGAIISQDGKPLAYYTRKLNSGRKKYIVGELELLGIVEGLKAFENILRGLTIIVYTDHLNLLYANNALQRIVWWHLIVEEFVPKEIQHFAGEDNAVADCLSRMQMEPSDFDLIEAEAPKPMLEYCNMLHNMDQLNTLKDTLKETIDKAQFPRAPKLINKA